MYVSVETEANDITTPSPDQRWSVCDTCI